MTCTRTCLYFPCSTVQLVVYYYIRKFCMPLYHDKIAISCEIQKGVCHPSICYRLLNKSHVHPRQAGFEIPPPPLCPQSDPAYLSAISLDGHPVSFAPPTASSWRTLRSLERFEQLVLLHGVCVYFFSHDVGLNSVYDKVA